MSVHTKDSSFTGKRRRPGDHRGKPGCHSNQRSTKLLAAGEGLDVGVFGGP